MMMGMKRSRLGHWRVQTEFKILSPFCVSSWGLSRGDSSWEEGGGGGGEITVVLSLGLLMGEVYNVPVWASP